MTPKQRKAARERCDKATAGPWRADWKDSNHYELQCLAADLPASQSFWLVLPDSGFERGDDLDFVAHARTDLPAALNEIDRLEAELAKLRETSTA